MVEWDGAEILRTPRLRLRRYRADDLPKYAQLNAQPQVAEMLGGPLSREESDSIAEWAMELWDRHRVGLLAVERLADGEFLGMCGLHRLSDRPDDIEVGWRLAYQHWGHGYATEAATAWLDYGFDVLGLPRVISTTDEANVRSLAVMRRLGLTFLENDRITDNGQTFDAVVYAITAAEWRARRAPVPA
ncbi:MAG TPA: GNAT family N-acetyltransferase [Mycobacteriales bacterium]|jgi:RimJ/RimL family protein N-acetyltransferase|nr:GNAT family N-acetyltransferase [Mycobacteriales bacterium]